MPRLVTDETLRQAAEFIAEQEKLERVAQLDAKSADLKNFYQQYNTRQLSAIISANARQQGVTAKSFIGNSRRRENLLNAAYNSSVFKQVYDRNRAQLLATPTNVEAVYQRLRQEVLAIELYITGRLNALKVVRPDYTTLNFMDDGLHIKDWISRVNVSARVKQLAEGGLREFIRDYAYDVIRQESGIRNIFENNPNARVNRPAFLHTRSKMIRENDLQELWHEKTYNFYVNYGATVYAPFENLWGLNAGGIASNIQSAYVAHIDFKTLAIDVNRYWDAVGFTGFVNQPGTLNCLIDSTAKQLPEPKRAQLLATYGHMRHGDTPYYINSDDIDKIGKKFGLCFNMYIPIDLDISARERRAPTARLGKAHGRTVNILVSNKHATVKPTHLCSRVEHIQPQEFTDEEYENIRGGAGDFIGTIDAKIYDFGIVPNKFLGHYRGIHGYRQYGNDVANDGARQVILRKYLAPAIITGNEADNNDYGYAQCVKPEQVFTKLFIKYNGVRASPGHLNKLISAAARPFGRWSAIDFNGELHEIDHNSSYTAFEASPYFVGFPHSLYRHKAADTTENLLAMENLAFVEISSMMPKNNEGQWLLERMPRSDWRCIAAPLFRLLARYMDFEIVSYVVAAHKKYELQSLVNALNRRIIDDLLAELNALAANPNRDFIEQRRYERLNAAREDGSLFSNAAIFTKYLRNATIGRLAIGGVDSEALDPVDYRTTDKHEFEMSIASYNDYAERHGIEKAPAIKDLFDGKEYYFRAFLKSRKNEKYLSTYSYCLAYSQCAMIDQLIATRQFEPVAIHVDAIYFNQKPEIKTATAPGAWKYQRKSAKLCVSAARYTAPQAASEAPLAQARRLKFSSGLLPIPPVNPLPEYPKLVITGAPGTCKTRSIIQTAPATSLFMAPTKEMRRKMRCDLQERGMRMEEAKHRAITSQCFSTNASKLHTWTKIKNGEHRIIPAKATWNAAYQQVERVNGRWVRGSLVVNTADMTQREIYQQYHHYKVRMNDITANVCTVIIDEFTKLSLSDMAFIADFCERRSIYLICLGDYCQTICAIENNTVMPDGFRERFNDPSAGVCMENMLALGFVNFVDPRNARSELNDKGHRHTFEYGTFLDAMRNMPIDEQAQYVIKSGRYATISRKTYFSNDYRPADNSLLIAGTWADVNAHTARQIAAYGNNTPVIRCRDIKTREVSVQAVAPNVWTSKKRMEDEAPKGSKFIAFEGASVDSLQGETVTMVTYIDVWRLSRHGALYTAITRSPTAGTLILLI